MHKKLVPLFVYVMLLLFPLIVTSIIGPSLLQLIGIRNFSYMFYGVLSVQVLFFVLAAIYLQKRLLSKQEKLEPILKTKWHHYVIFPILFIFFSFLLSKGASYFFNQKQETANIFLSIGLPLSLIIASLFAVLEEILFRKVMQGWLEKKIKGKKKVGIVLIISIPALLFSLTHWQGFYNIVIFLLAIPLGVIYYVYKNIKLNSFIHVTNNIVGVMLIFMFVPNNMYSFQSDYMRKEMGILDKLSYAYSKDREASYASFNLSYNLFWDDTIKEGIKGNEQKLLEIGKRKKRKLEEFVKRGRDFTEADKKVIEEAFLSYDSILRNVEGY